MRNRKEVEKGERSERRWSSFGSKSREESVNEADRV